MLFHFFFHLWCCGWCYGCFYIGARCCFCCGRYASCFCYCRWCWCGWLPFWAQRLDEHFEKLRPQWPDCQRKPSEVIRSGQIALTCEPEEEILPYVLDTMGQHLVMYASDYAHWDSECPESVRMVAGLPGLREEQKRRVLGQNAIEWFGLRPEELPERSVYFGEAAAAGTAAR